MKEIRRHAAARLLFVCGLGWLCAAPTPGDIGGCGQHPELLDPEAFFALKRAEDCKKCTDCNFTTDFCSDVCSTDDEAPGFPEGCVPLVHDGEVCLNALEAASCDEYEDYAKDEGRLAPSECQFCPEILP
jgi:hypothetical protein